MNREERMQMQDRQVAEWNDSREGRLVAAVNGRRPALNERVSLVIEAGAKPAQTAAPTATPLVSKLAAQYSVDLSTVRGTGAGGRVTKQDVQAAGAWPSAITEAVNRGAIAEERIPVFQAMAQENPRAAVELLDSLVGLGLPLSQLRAVDKAAAATTSAAQEDDDQAYAVLVKRMGLADRFGVVDAEEPCTSEETAYAKALGFVREW